MKGFRLASGELLKIGLNFGERHPQCAVIDWSQTILVST
jgi:hypothetical protein